MLYKNNTHPNPTGVKKPAHNRAFSTSFIKPLELRMKTHNNYGYGKNTTF